MTGAASVTTSVDDVIDLDTPFGQQLLDIAVGQAVAQIPTDRDHDHLRRKPEPSERRPRS